MATYTKTRTMHATLVAATVDTVTLSVVSSTVEVVNRGATGDIFLTLDGTAPTVSGDDTFVVAANTARVFGNPLGIVDAPHGDTPTTTVKLISSGTPSYSVLAR